MSAAKRKRKASARSKREKTRAKARLNALALPWAFDPVTGKRITIKKQKRLAKLLGISYSQMKPHTRTSRESPTLVGLG